MERHDDLTLAGDLVLWRRIPPWAGRVQWNTETGEPTPSSMNFRDAHDELSIYIGSETSIGSVLEGHPGFGIVELTADQIRATIPHAILFRDPDPHPAHVLVCGKISHGQSKRLARVCRWVVQPTRSQREDAD